MDASELDVGRMLAAAVRLIRNHLADSQLPGGRVAIHRLLCARHPALAPDDHLVARGGPLGGTALVFVMFGALLLRASVLIDLLPFC